MRRRGAAVLAACGMVLAGCGTSGQAVQPTQVNRTFAEALQTESEHASSDFEREVLGRALESGEIVAADYEEAVSRYLACAAEAGHLIDTVRLPNGIYQWLPRGDSDPQAYMDDTYVCAQGTTMIIEALYKLQITNPDGRDIAEVALECLTEAGVTDGSYTVAQFNDDVVDGFDRAPFDVADEGAAACLVPLGVAVG
ncbi:hypothetical protein [Cellulomonas triticagri]|nr:hypothetical protein [Cellulomonas triticagri]